jgi:hypothetical protein
MRPPGLAGALALTLVACASFGPITEGRSGPVAWQATDLELTRRPAGWFYTGSILLKETEGVALSFNEIRMLLGQPGAGAWSATYNGVWRLAAHGQMRIPLSSSLRCGPGEGTCLGPDVPIPMWRITLTGKTESGRSVEIIVDARFPADPPSPPTVSSKSVPAIEFPRRPSR